MALWQVGFFILPKSKFNSFQILDEDTFDDSFYWINERVGINLFDEIVLFLTKTKSWSDKLIIYGNEDSNRFEILFDNDIVESVSFRIDFTSNYQKVLQGIVEFCISNDLIILDEKLNIIPLNFDSMAFVIKNAPQVLKYNSFLNS